MRALGEREGELGIRNQIDRDLGIGDGLKTMKKSFVEKGVSI